MSLDSLNSQIEHYAPILALAFAVLYLLINYGKLSMLQTLLTQIARLRDELLPLVSGLTAKVADLTTQLETANARNAELEAELAGLPAAADNLTQINDQLAGMVAA